MRHQAFAADLELAVRLATPHRDTDGGDIPDTTSTLLTHGAPDC